MTKILIVEDDFALGQNIQAMLKGEGFDVEFAPDGKQGLDAAQKFKPKIVLLDLLIPNVSGFDVCRQLRSDPKHAGMKILVMTGLDRTADVEKAFSSGANDYLVKPFDRERLLGKIKKLLAP